MREQARAKFAAREPTYAILPGLPPVYTMASKISQFSNHHSISTPSHTIHYNSATIPVPAPAAVPQKYQHLQEQTPSLSEHHHIPQDSWGGREGRTTREREEEKKKECRWKDEHSCCREKRINTEREDRINTLRTREGRQFALINSWIRHKLFLFPLIWSLPVRVTPASNSLTSLHF